MRSTFLFFTILLGVCGAAGCSEDKSDGTAGASGAAGTASGGVGGMSSGGTGAGGAAGISSGGSNAAGTGTGGQGGGVEMPTAGDAADPDAGVECVGGEIQCGDTCVGPSQMQAEGCAYLGKINSVVGVAQDDTTLYFGNSLPPRPIRQVVLPSDTLEDLSFMTTLPAELIDFALSEDSVYAAMLIRPHYRIDVAPKAGGDVRAVVDELEDIQDIQIQGEQLFVSGTIAGEEGLFAFDLEGQGQQRLVEEAVGEFRVDGDQIYYVFKEMSLGGPIKSVPIGGGVGTEVMPGQYGRIVAVSGGTVFASGYGGTSRSAPAGGMATPWMRIASSPDPAVPESVGDLYEISARAQVGDQLLAIGQVRASKEWVVMRGALSDAEFAAERIFTFKAGETGSPEFVAQAGNKLYVAMAYYSIQDWFVVSIDLN